MSDLDDINKAADQDTKGVFGALSRAWETAKRLPGQIVRDDINDAATGVEVIKYGIRKEGQLEDSIDRGMLNTGKRAVRAATNLARNHPGATEAAIELSTGDLPGAEITAAGIGLRAVNREIAAHDRGVIGEAKREWTAEDLQSTAQAQTVSLSYASDPTGKKRTPHVTGTHGRAVHHTSRHHRSERLAFRTGNELGGLHHVGPKLIASENGILDSTWSTYRDTAEALAKRSHVSLHAVSPGDVLALLKSNATSDTKSADALMAMGSAAKAGHLQLGGVQNTDVVMMASMVRAPSLMAGQPVVAGPSIA